MTVRPFPLTLRPVADTGRIKVAEPTDPYEAVAVGVPTPGYDGMAAMARTFVEEFARIGWERDRIARMFRIPRYLGPHAVYRSRGPEFVESLIDEVLGPAARTERGRRG